MKNILFIFIAIFVNVNCFASSNTVVKNPKIIPYGCENNNCKLNIKWTDIDAKSKIENFYDAILASNGRIEVNEEFTSGKLSYENDKIATVNLLLNSFQKYSAQNLDKTLKRNLTSINDKE